MKNDNTPISAAQTAMTEAAVAVLDTKFLKALTDKTRVEIIKKLIMTGASDVTTIARGLSQDRSVISRHLATLEKAGIAASRKQGRHMIYDLDGPYIVQKVTLILQALEPMAELCRPFEETSKTGDAA